MRPGVSGPAPRRTRGLPVGQGRPQSGAGHDGGAGLPFDQDRTPLSPASPHRISTPRNRAMRKDAFIQAESFAKSASGMPNVPSGFSAYTVQMSSRPNSTCLTSSPQALKTLGTEYVEATARCRPLMGPRKTGVLANGMQHVQTDCVSTVSCSRGPGESILQRAAHLGLVR